MSTQPYAEVSLNDAAESLVSEEVPSLSDFDEGPGGALPKGWYGAEIIEGFTTAKGRVVETGDAPSKNGTSRNLQLCFKIAGTERVVTESINYRTTDFNPERRAHVKEMRQEFKGVKGAWPDKDAQRTSLAIAKLARLEASVGFAFKRNPLGGLDPTPLVGQKVDVYLSINEDDYNEVTKFATANTKAKAAK